MQMQAALDSLKDDKFVAATGFTKFDYDGNPAASRIISSVVNGFSKVLAQHCPFPGLTSGTVITRFFNENFSRWFLSSFSHLSQDHSLFITYKAKARGWFMTNLKRNLKKSYL
jgi:hypothetical protein